MKRPASQGFFCRSPGAILRESQLNTHKLPNEPTTPTRNPNASRGPCAPKYQTNPIAPNRAVKPIHAAQRLRQFPIGHFLLSRFSSLMIWVTPAAMPRKMPRTRRMGMCSQWSAKVPKMYPATTEAGSVSPSEMYFPNQISELSRFFRTNSSWVRFCKSPLSTPTRHPRRF